MQLTHNIQELTNYLQFQQWLQPNEIIVSAIKPGEGNMNFVLRITTNIRSFIVKQSRPFVEKYPQIVAPEQRVLSEAAYYNCIAGNPFLQSFSPTILGVDEQNFVLCIEDMGQLKDYSFLYGLQETIPVETVQQLAHYLSTLHTNYNKPNGNALLQNTAMRILNQLHIFVLPFSSSHGFNLNIVQEGLQAIAMPYQNDSALQEKATELGNIYLEDGNYLLHGDFYPGSWLQSSTGVKVIDPEFCFYGCAEFDVAVCIAHLLLSKQPQTVVDAMLNNYQKPSAFSMVLLHQLMGIEVMRRLIGLAQLPVSLSIAEKEVILHQAYNLVMNN